MLFKNRLMWTINRANNPIWSNPEDPSHRFFLWFIGVSTSLFVPVNTWRLSSVTIHCSPSLDDSPVLGSTSSSFVLLIDFMSSGLASVTASLLLIHFIGSNLCCERRGCSCFNTSIASLGFLLIWWKSSMWSCFFAFAAMGYFSSLLSPTYLIA